MNNRKTKSDDTHVLVKEDEDTDALPSRRDFLVFAAGGAAAAAIASSCSTDVSDSEGSDNPDDSNGSNDTGGTDTHEVTAPPSNRVVRVIDSDATTWNGQDPSDFYQYAVQDVVDAMVERGVMELTGESSPEAAWGALIPYQTDDIVLIHLNAYPNEDNSAKNNVAAPISAVVHGLVDILGIPAENIAISDPSRTLRDPSSTARIIDGCRYKDGIQWDLYKGEYTQPVTYGGSVSDTLARVTAEAAHIIMMPVLSWHSSFITGAMKMMFGSLESQGGAMHQVDMGDGPAKADMCLYFKDRVRLLVGDGLFGNVNGNASSPHTFQTLGGRNGAKPSSTLYFTKDMVALDSIMYDDILDEARAQGSEKGGYQTGFLAKAADASHQLGTFEMRNVTGGSSYSQIELVDVDLT